MVYARENQFNTYLSIVTDITTYFSALPSSFFLSLFCLIVCLLLFGYYIKLGGAWYKNSMVQYRSGLFSSLITVSNLHYFFLKPLLPSVVDVLFFLLLIICFVHT